MSKATHPHVHGHVHDENHQPTTTTATNTKQSSAADDSSSDDEDSIEELQYKICILGDGAVGKTSITHRFTSDQFAQSYKQTIGVDFFVKR